MNNTVLEPPYSKPYWLASEVGIWVCTLSFVYLLLGCALYLASFGKDKKKVTTEQKLLRICVFSSCFALARMVSDHTVAFVGWRNNTTCIRTVNVSTALYAPSIYSIYVFLWFRQNEFYSNPILKHLANKHLIRFSRVTILLLFIAGFAVTVLFQIPEVTGWDFKATPSGCIDVADIADIEALPTILVVITIVGQVALLGLLVYPILVTKKNQQQMTSSRSVTSPKVDRSRPLLQQAIVGRMRERGSVGMDAARKSSDVIDDVGSSDDDISHSELCWSEGESTDCESQAGDITMHGSTRGHRFTRRDGGSPAPRRVASLGSPKRIKVRKLRRTPRKSSMRKREQKLTILIKKVSILASICVASDVTATILQIMISLPELVYFFIFDVNLLINTVCVLLSFKQWRKIFFPRFTPPTPQPHDPPSSGGNTTNTHLPNHDPHGRNLDNVSIRSGLSTHTEMIVMSRSGTPEVHDVTRV
uniref:Uncharacterized LOC100184962 n=1 Tax=Ciona intestinalis TaxID=7719 RepID=F6SEJ9_CIOIN|nr:uncharacterized protein LOC100184962 [Ciona intestinalis]|eukprot:XP_002121332.3 uncharacterized protein LOC100184962 [Ciona intestinalis]